MFSPEPRVDQAQAHVAVAVQVRVDGVPVGAVMDIRRAGRVIRWERHVEKEETVVVGGAGGAHDDCSEQIDAFLVYANVYGIGEAAGEDFPLSHYLLVHVTPYSAEAF